MSISSISAPFYEYQTQLRITCFTIQCAPVTVGGKQCLSKSTHLLGKYEHVWEGIEGKPKLRVPNAREFGAKLNVERRRGLAMGLSKPFQNKFFLIHALNVQSAWFWPI